MKNHTDPFHPFVDLAEDVAPPTGCELPLREADEVRFGVAEMSRFSVELQRLTGLRPVISDPDSEFWETTSSWAVDLFTPKGNIYLGYFNVIVYAPQAKMRPGWNIHMFAQEGSREMGAAIDQAIKKAFKL
jgi:hypothetical protein